MWPDVKVFRALVAWNRRCCHRYIHRRLLVRTEMPGRKMNGIGRWLEESGESLQIVSSLLRMHKQPRRILSKRGSKRRKFSVKVVCGLFFANGSSSKEKPFLITADTTSKKSCKNGWDWQNIHKLLKKNEDIEAIAIMDACFSGTTPENEPLNVVTETLPAKDLAYERLSLLMFNKMDGCLGEIPNLRRNPFSYLALGALRGWGDVDFDGQITMQEMLGYVNKVFSIVTPERPRDSILISDTPNFVMSKAQEEGPDLEEIEWILALRSKEKKKEDATIYLGIKPTIQEILTTFGGSWRAPKNGIHQRKRAKPKKRAAKRQSDIGIRYQNLSIKRWMIIPKWHLCGFWTGRINRQVQVQETIDINIEEVSSAKKWFLAASSHRQDAPDNLLGFQVVHFKWALQRQIKRAFRRKAASCTDYTIFLHVHAWDYPSSMSLWWKPTQCIAWARASVNQVSWFDTIQFANRLSSKKGLNHAILSMGNKWNGQKDWIVKGIAFQQRPSGNTLHVGMFPVRTQVVTALSRLRGMKATVVIVFSPLVEKHPMHLDSMIWVETCGSGYGMVMVHIRQKKHRPDWRRLKFISNS